MYSSIIVAPIEHHLRYTQLCLSFRLDVSCRDEWAEYIFCRDVHTKGRGDMLSTSGSAGVDMNVSHILKAVFESQMTACELLQLFRKKWGGMSLTRISIEHLVGPLSPFPTLLERIPAIQEPTNKPTN